MKYLDQSSRSIRHILVRGNPSIEQFNLLAQNSFSWSGFDVNFGILGESHFVNMGKNGEEITEICACTDAAFESEGSEIIVSEFLHDMSRPHFSYIWKDVSYSFKYQNFGYKRGVDMLQYLRELRHNSSMRFLHYAFPAPFSTSDKPVTEVIIEEKSEVLCVHSVHTYPNEDMVVLTQSVFGDIQRTKNSLSMYIYKEMIQGKSTLLT